MHFLTAMFGDEEEIMGHATRRSPAVWHRQRLVTTWLVLGMVYVTLLGVLVGAWSVQWFSPTWTIWGVTGLLIVSFAATWWLSRGKLGRLRKRYSTLDLQKGVEAERRTGEVIEFSLAHQNCAAAHNVTLITDAGDIDHLVVTPHTVWVVDSKFRYGGRWLDDKINGVVRQVRAVERWVAQQGFGQTPVKGCLAFLTGFDGDVHEHTAKDGTSILCVNVSERSSNGLTLALHEDMRRPGRTVDKALVSRIWKLGAGVE